MKNLAVRLPEDFHDELSEEAKLTGQSVSELARERLMENASHDTDLYEATVESLMLSRLQMKFGADGMKYARALYEPWKGGSKRAAISVIESMEDPKQQAPAAIRRYAYRYVIPQALAGVARGKDRECNASIDKVFANFSDDKDKYHEWRAKLGEGQWNEAFALLGA